MSRQVKFFADGIGFRFWHHYGKPHGTAVRCYRCKNPLFGLMLKPGGVHVGLWWHFRLELIAVHSDRFSQ